MTAGHAGLFAAGVTSIRTLRALGCALPVEVYYLDRSLRPVDRGAPELPPEALATLRALPGVTTVALSPLWDAALGGSPLARAGGVGGGGVRFRLKPLALLAALSHIDEVGDRSCLFPPDKRGGRVRATTTTTTDRDNGSATVTTTGREPPPTERKVERARSARSRFLPARLALARSCARSPHRTRALTRAALARLVSPPRARARPPSRAPPHSHTRR